MPNQSEFQLIDYLDNRLSAQERAEVEQLIHTNHQTFEQWRYLQLSVEAIEYAGLYNQVGAVKEQYKAQQNKPGTFRRMRFVITAAAAFIIAMGLGVYKYSSTTAVALYKENYAPYQLNTTRSAGAASGIEEAYRNENWSAAIAAFNNTPEKDNKMLFLAAMSQMELKHYAEAAKNFEQLQLNNASTNDDYFQEETEYYQALCYLALNRGKEAVVLLNRIRENKSHLFFQQASQISGIDLRIVESKSAR